ncbi:hypothetical protein AC578_275 [Pseudocercospora eumusae]|uniref:Uncharacterized protein n=1 Tax=Pseudocercospora eumusae TaxID=321146 RepID=A0A139H6Y8_9PEZI|nr:hypothetical protein AC578_275 [Pseudocercospora eumusae]
MYKILFASHSACGDALEWCEKGIEREITATRTRKYQLMALGFVVAKLLALTGIPVAAAHWPSTPCTRNSASTTAVSSVTGPILFVQNGW